MAANPITDQYVQAMHVHRARDLKAAGATDNDAHRLDGIIERLADELRAGLPNLDTTTIGEAALHTVVAIGTLYRQMLSNNSDAQIAANAAINVAGQAAARLYGSEAGS